MQHIVDWVEARRKDDHGSKIPTFAATMGPPQPQQAGVGSSTKKGDTWLVCAGEWSLRWMLPTVYCNLICLMVLPTNLYCAYGARRVSMKMFIILTRGVYYSLSLPLSSGHGLDKKVRVGEKVSFEIRRETGRFVSLQL